MLAESRRFEEWISSASSSRVFACLESPFCLGPILGESCFHTFSPMIRHDRPKDDFLKSPQAKSTDGVIIATSHSSHYEVGMKAMGHFHILMEKPMTTDLTEADDLAKTALRCDKIFMLNNTANFRPSAEKVHDMIKSPCLKIPCVIERLLPLPQKCEPFVFSKVRLVRSKQ